MEEYIRQGDETLRSLEKLFPVKSVENAVQVMSTLISAHQPNLALCSLFLSAIQKIFNTVVSAKKKPVLTTEHTSISWANLHNSWKRFVSVVRKWQASNKRSAVPEVVSRPSKRAVLDIYELIEKVAAIGDRPSEVGGLESLVDALDERSLQTQSVISVQNAKSKTANRADSRASFDLSEVKVFTLIIAQMLGHADVHLHLSEKRVFLGIGGDPDFELVDIKTYEHNSLPKVSNDKKTSHIGHAILPSMDKLWLCSGGHFVHCDRFVEVAYLCCDLHYSGTFEEGAKIPHVLDFQRQILRRFVDRGLMNRYPMGLAMYGNLESRFGDPQFAEEALLRAVKVGQEHYDNAYVFPYCFYMEHLIRAGRFAAALVPIEMASKVAGRYVYLNDFDKGLHAELSKINDTHVPAIFHNLEPADLDNPLIASLLLSYIDNLCAWEENGSMVIIHSLWIKVFTKELQKVAGVLPQIIKHSSAEIFEASLQPSRIGYLTEMISALEKSEPKIIPYKSKFADYFVDFDRETCERILQIYIEWPPFHATESFLSHEIELYALPKTKEANPEFYQKILDKFKSWPTGERLSPEDLLLMRPFRELNPLYELCSCQVFPFLDMGPRNIAMACFDLARIRREIPVPRIGSVEYAVIEALCGRIYELGGQLPLGGNGQFVPVPVSQVLMRSKKMLSVMPLLESPKLNAKQLQLALEGASEGSSKRRR